MIELNQKEVLQRAHEIYEEKLKAPAEVKEAALQSESEQKIREELNRISRETQPHTHHGTSIQATVSALLELDDREKIAELIDIAFTKGPQAAVGIARKLDRPIVLDTLHDLLARDEVYYQLLKAHKV